MAKISKNTIAIIAFVITLIIFIGAFSSSYSYQNMSNLAYVLAIGIDKGEKAKIHFNLQNLVPFHHKIVLPKTLAILY